MNLFSLLAELQRRNVHRAAIFYAGASWLLVQVATQVLPFFDIPASTVRFVVIAVVVGFPFAMLFSWFYEITPDGVKPESEIDHSLPAVRSGGKRLDRWIIAVLALAVVVLLAERLVPTKPVAVSIDKSIAVLPFTDLSPAHDQEYFSDGIAEELLNALARVQDLKVAGRSSSFSFRGRQEDLRSIGQKLGVAHILEGSVRKQGNRVRISAQLIQTRDGYQLWSDSYDSELTDIFDLQEQIARAITGQLQVILDGGQQQRLVPVATISPEAYALFLQATTTFNRRDGARFPEAIAALREAIRLDPDFARAHARLASIYAIAPTITTLDRELLLGSAEQAANTAMQLDPALAEPHAALGMVHTQRRNLIAARAALEKAVALDPQDVTAGFWLGTTMISGGYGRAGAAQLDQVLALDPLLPNGLSWRGTAYFNAGDAVRAENMLRKAVASGLVFGRYPLARLAHSQGRDAEAIADLRAGLGPLLAGLPDEASGVFAEGFFGDDAARSRALALVDGYLATAAPPISGVVPWALLNLGEPARALALSQAAQTRNDSLMMAELWSPRGEAARRLPQFAEFAQHFGLAALWDRYGAPDTCTRRAPGDYDCH